MLHKGSGLVLFAAVFHSAPYKTCLVEEIRRKGFVEETSRYENTLKI